MSDPIDHDHQESAPAEPTSLVRHPPEDDESTVGVGTGLALGCIALTVVLILLGLLFLLVVRVFA